MIIDKIQFKRTTEAKRTSYTPLEGEPVVTAEQELFLGDGATAGGYPVGTVKPTGSIVADMVALFTDTTGRIVKGITKADLLNGYATEVYVTNALQGTSGIKVDAAVRADVATNAESLGGTAASSYFKSSNITDSYTLDDATRVTSAKGIKTFYDYVVGLIAPLSALLPKVDTNTTNISNLQSSATTIGTKVDTNTTHLSKLPGQVVSGTGDPSGGSDGDIYIQYR